MTTTNYDDVPPPAGATRVWDEWELLKDTGHPDPIRYFYGTARTVYLAAGPDIEVRIEGIQHSDGRVERAIRVNGASDVISIAHARGLARALIAAADELDRLEA